MTSLYASTLGRLLKILLFLTVLCYTESFSLDDDRRCAADVFERARGGIDHASLLSAPFCGLTRVLFFSIFISNRWRAKKKQIYGLLLILFNIWHSFFYTYKLCVVVSSVTMFLFKYS